MEATTDIETHEATHCEKHISQIEATSREVTTNQIEATAHCEKQPSVK